MTVIRGEIWIADLNFLPVHNLTSLEQLAAALAQTSDERPEQRQSRAI